MLPSRLMRAGDSARAIWPVRMDGKKDYLAEEYMGPYGERREELAFLHSPAGQVELMLMAMYNEAAFFEGHTR